VSVYPAQSTHNQIVGNGCYSCIKHKRKDDQLENKFCTRERMLSQRVSAHRGKNKLPCRSCNRDKQGVKKVTRNRHPGVLQKNKQINKVFKCRVARQQWRWKKPQLIQWLKGIADR